MTMFATPTDEERELFLRISVSEGWRVPRNELALLNGPYATSFTVMRHWEEVVGFVSAVRHGDSGWIGNLIVPPYARDKGYGSLLFDRALQELIDAGATSVWLTASAQGRPIYEKRGFRTVGHINRWQGTGRGDLRPESGAGLTTLLEHDKRSWWDDRSGLIRHLSYAGRTFLFGETSALLQDAGDFAVLGPWLTLSGCPRENRLVLTSALEATPPGVEIVTDIVETSPAAPLLAVAGFERIGRCDLMVHGPSGADLARIVSLATLGSLG